jgi:hypothetical protein
MGYAKTIESVPQSEAVNDHRYRQWWEVIWLAVSQRLRQLDISMEEYKRRVAIKLRWHKIWHTSDRDIDILIKTAPAVILKELESLVLLERGVFKWWRLQSGKSVAIIRDFVLSVLDE